jgi:ubiquinone/menaquinone biosynthesis C-methylase UbiE
VRELRPHETWWQQASNNFLRNRSSQHDNPSRRAIHEIVTRAGAKTVLESACATAIDFPRYRDSGHQWHGLDITEKFLARAKELHPEIQVTHGSVLEAPFPENSFDFVYCKDLLEHLAPEDYKKALSEMYRMCRIGIAVALFIPLQEKTEYLTVRRKWPRRIFDKRIYYKNTYGREEFLATLRSLGGRVEEHTKDAVYAVFKKAE